ncbi:MAG: hypothetical protein BWX83_00996 [Candidatus Cloacimonetes bacterium ADurb.Bin117]|nr:MAG: hypothetical protein BWX83_00996 [Candidatus Cloacimonetes bacterium ADurb.Bin117]
MQLEPSPRLKHLPVQQQLAVRIPTEFPIGNALSYKVLPGATGGTHIHERDHGIAVRYQLQLIVVGVIHLKDLQPAFSPLLLTINIQLLHPQLPGTGLFPNYRGCAVLQTYSIELC